MRRLKVALLVLVFALPMSADDRPPIGGMDPEQGEGCVECSRDENAAVECGGLPTGPGWMNCEGGYIRLCDGYAGCTWEPNCGQRCAIA